MEAVLLGMVLMLSIFLGFELISKVPATLHTPLMSGANAISGITIVGALISAGAELGTTATVLGALAVTFATINVVGGYLVTETAGIAAAFVGHAIFRFALFVTMGPPERAVVEQVHTATGGTGDKGAYVIPPRQPGGSGGNDGRGGVGPIRPG